MFLGFIIYLLFHVYKKNYAYIDFERVDVIYKKTLSSIDLPLLTLDIGATIPPFSPFFSIYQWHRLVAARRRHFPPYLYSYIRLIGGEEYYTNLFCTISTVNHFFLINIKEKPTKARKQ